jgi:hypothetical protein
MIHILLFYFILQFSSSRWRVKKSSSLTVQIFMKGLRENDMREDKKVFHENGKSFFSHSAILRTPLGTMEELSNCFQ